jgi:hypothetical protein
MSLSQIHCLDYVICSAPECRTSLPMRDTKERETAESSRGSGGRVSMLRPPGTRGARYRVTCPATRGEDEKRATSDRDSHE